MQYRELITKIAKNKEYLTICRKITGGNLLYKDLFQEALIILLEYDNQKIIDIYERGEIKFFITRIFIILYTKKTSPFNRKYIKYQSLGTNKHKFSGNRNDDHSYDIEKDQDTEKKCTLIKEELKIENDDDPLWYENKLFLEFLAKGSIKKLAEDTQINYQSISSTIRKVRKRIKDKYEQA